MKTTELILMIPHTYINMPYCCYGLMSSCLVLDIMNKSTRIFTRTDQIIQNSRQITCEREAAETDDKLKENFRRSARCRTISRRLLFDQVYSLLFHRHHNHHQ